MMASACVNNVGTSPEAFLDCPPACPSYGWLSPRISFSRDLADDGTPASAAEEPEAEKPDLDAAGKDLADFEFRLHDPVAMLPADELFADGKLVPLQLATARPVAEMPAPATHRIRSPEVAAETRRVADVLGSDVFVAESPKAPRCSSRWRELLGLKRQQSSKPETQKAAVSAPSKNHNTRSLRHFLHRNSKPKSSSTDSSLSLPLLRDSSDAESVSISSRLSLSSSSSSGPDHEDLPRLSLDAEKPSRIPLSLGQNPPRVRVARTRTTVPDGHQASRVGRSPVRRPPEAAAASRGASVDSPRMNASGKVVFQGLERSSSSPSSFSGGPRIKYRSMERSYSANVRITPVLNVPVCSLRGSSKSVTVFGFGQLFSPQKKEEGSMARSSSNGSRAKIERRKA
ncbi:uncharacterized protein LOC103722887 [Phoenix dactylifera]|uniref:Uncharacterized protein LOC103722887 n=1 Tax=Phoenix dactylifera TaxID=42345 RepID=A0A8B7D2G3_PHODC|nr:uncharacterized protein LOC103722887 [Phoenix dactylifera]